MDLIHINHLTISCVLGVKTAERQSPQSVVINLTLHVDTRSAVATDSIANTVDYDLIATRIASTATAKRFYLVESLAAYIAQLCLNNDRVHKVEVTVLKPGALALADSAGVSLVRERSCA